ncbi:MAG: aminotransferase DegT [Lentisphaerae bacterium]|nr:aminotransferase DegT [Lentisphaerota bacterium]
MRKNRLFLSPPCVGPDERACVAEAFDSNYIAPCGPQVDAFERAMAERTGIPHALALSSATAALHLLYRELGAGPDGAVVAPTLTFVASVAPAVQMGAEAVLVDSNEATWTLDPERADDALRTLAREGRRVAAVVAVDLYGQCCDYDALDAVCKRHGVPLIIDAAEALGATYRGRAAGAAGAAAVYSFNGNKIITTSGGGLLASADAALVARARHLSQQAREDEAWYEHRTLGYNYRMSNLVAAVGVGQLRHLDDIVAKRRTICGWYRERLADVPQVRFMPEAAYGAASRWLTVVCFDGDAESGESGRPGDTSQRIRLALESENIEARPVWKPMHLQPVFRGARTFGGGIAERLFSRGLCLPSGTAMTESDCDEVCAVIRRALGA